MMEAYDVKISYLFRGLMACSGGSVVFSGRLVAISGGSVVLSGGLEENISLLVVFSGMPFCLNRLP